MPKKSNPDARQAEVRDMFVKRVQELWEVHESEIQAVLKDAESQKLNLSFTAKLDFSESAAKLVTSICFSQVVKESREDDFEDPNQPALPGLTKAEAAEEASEGEVSGDEKPPKRGRGRPRKPRQEKGNESVA